MMNFENEVAGEYLEYGDGCHPNMLNILAARKLLNFSLSITADTNSSLESGPIRDEDSGLVTSLHQSETRTVVT